MKKRKKRLKKNRDDIDDALKEVEDLQDNLVEEDDIPAQSELDRLESEINAQQRRVNELEEN